MRLLAALIIAALAIAAYAATEHKAPNDGLPMTRADYSRCVKINPGPLKPPRRSLPSGNSELV